MAYQNGKPERTGRDRTRWFGLVIALVLLGSLAVSAPGLFRAATTATAAAATGIEPVHVTFEKSGCRNDGTIVLPNGDGKFICDDADYTSGNLGPGWNELDLVPYRHSTSVGNQADATTTFSFALALDYVSAGKIGYDFISAPVINTDLSDASCSISSSEQLGDDPAYPDPGAGPSIYRIVTVTQDKGTTCVFDWYGRLALGSHLYPGASLHANLYNQNLGTQGIGSKEISIPVNAILPQELDKDMTASQDTTHAWSVTKSPTPATLSFGNVCDAGFDPTLGVDIKITWTKLAATPTGGIVVVTHVYATNPAARVITVNVTDSIRSGTTQIDSATSGPVDVTANTANFLVLTHTFTAQAGSTDLNDIATATYTDKVTGIPVPGTTTATASAGTIQPGNVLNGSATVTDSESITGANLTFAVAAPAVGSFTGGYTAGTYTTGPVGWTSGTQSGSGEATLNKTVKLDPAATTTGKLSDTATVTGSGGFTAQTSAEVNISSSVAGSLTVTKTIPNVLQGAETDSFSFTVTGPGGYSENRTLNFAAGDTSKSFTLTGLAEGSYNIDETASGSGKWALLPDQQASIGPASCSPSRTFNNQLAPASARVAKVTVPAGGEAGWDMYLNGPGIPAPGEKVTTTGAGFVAFTTTLQEGSYTITETPKSGYDQTGSAGDCSFTVSYPADADRVFSCTFTNTQRGHIIVKKLTDPAGSPAVFEFDPSYSATNFNLSDTQTNDSGPLTPGTYSVSETAKAGWDLTSATCDDNSPVSAISLQAGETVTCTFNNRQRARLIVEKQTIPDGSSATFSFTGTAAGTIGDGGNIPVGNLIPGTYTSTEGAKAGWDLISIVCNDGDSTGDKTTRTATFRLQPGETVKCTFTNQERGKTKVIKTVAGQPWTSASPTFTFQLREGASDSTTGTVVETLTTTTANGGVLEFSTTLTPGNHYQMCEAAVAGWMTTLNDPVFSPFNPNSDVGYLCTDFVAVAGQTTAFTVNNTPPPGGNAATIGYWKNWATCAKSKGGQSDELTKTLAKAPGGGILFGTLFVDTCQEAVNILNKSTQSGQKKASDPLFNMAAQLMAADLNGLAGAATCATVAQAKQDAHKLLVDYNWNGTTYSPALTAADATKANNLAKLLDGYNNNDPVC
jgi:hypothetical protein